MKIKKCAWCQRMLNNWSKILSKLNIDATVSHGICWDCKIDQETLLEKTRRSGGKQYEIKNQTKSEVQVEGIY